MYFSSLIFFIFLTVICTVFINGQPPAQSCAGRCGPNEWVVACRTRVECSSCPAGTISPPGSWSINQCRGCDPGFFCSNCEVFNQNALTSMTRQNTLFCTEFGPCPRTVFENRFLALDTTNSTHTVTNEDLVEFNHGKEEEADEEQNAAVLYKRALQARASCQPCPRGQVQPAANQQSCYPCPAGMFAFDSR